MDLFDPAEIDFHEMADECRREVEMRRRVYPNQVMAGRLKAEEARRRIAVMSEVARLLQVAAEMNDQKADGAVDRGQAAALRGLA